MDCEAFHSDLPDLIYGELRGERKAAGETHMAGCPGCTELVSDLQTVRTAQKRHTPSPLLTAQIKLAARDELLDEPRTPVLGWGGSLHIATIAVLAACVCLAGFGLGIGYERGRDAPRPTPLPNPLPFARDDTPTERPPRLARDEPETIEISNGDGRTESDVPRPQRDPEAWQRSMEGAARGHLSRGDWSQAREFFLAAAEAAPQGPRAAAALAGAAEALLRAGDKTKAREEIETLRRKVMAGRLTGDAALLQRLLELSDEAQDR
jgi:hypothetical protein